LDIQGNRLWSTYYGGNGFEFAGGADVDSGDNIFIGGSTGSANFPTTSAGARQGIADCFLISFDANGLRRWAQYYGGNNKEVIRDIVADENDNVVVCGQTTSINLPTTGCITPSTYQGGGPNVGDGFIARFANANGLLQWGTYVGGSSDDVCVSVAVDGNNDVVVTGTTQSSDFVPAITGTKTSLWDAFVLKYTQNCTPDWGVVYGGTSFSSQEPGYAVDIDLTNNDIVVTGETPASNFPVLNGRSYISGNKSTFISKFDKDGTMLWSTYYEGEVGNDVKLDAAGTIWLTGNISTANLSTTVQSFQPNYGGGISDAFVANISSDGATTLCATYYGGSDYEKGNGIALDNSGNVLITGEARSADLKGVNANSLQPASAGGSDAYIASICANCGIPQDTSYIANEDTIVYQQDTIFFCLGDTTHLMNLFDFTNTTGDSLTTYPGNFIEWFNVTANVVADIVDPTVMVVAGNNSWIKVSPTDTTKYRLVSSAVDCRYDTNYVVVVPISPPTAQFISLNDTIVICKDDTAKIDVLLTGIGDWNIKFMYDTAVYDINGVFVELDTVYIDTLNVVGPIMQYFATDSGWHYISRIEDQACDSIDQDSIYVQWLDLPSATITGGGDVCEKDSAEFTVTFNGYGLDDYDFSYVYSEGVIKDTTEAFDLTSPHQFYVSDSGWYEIIYVADSLCQDSITAAKKITVQPKPTFTINNPEHANPDKTITVCAGENVVIALTFTGTANFTVNYTHKTFNASSTPVNTDDSFGTGSLTYNLNAPDSGWYVFTKITDAYCDSLLEDSIRVAYYSTPTLDISTTDNDICIGESTDLEFTLTGSGPFDVSLNQNPPTVADLTGLNTGDQVTVTPAITTTYKTIDLTDANNCTATIVEEVTITVNPLPSVVANATSTSICDGDAVTLTGSGADTYVWDNGVTDNVAFNPIATTTYEVTGTDANNCVNTDQIQVVVNPLPTVTANATSTTICDGDAVTLSGSGASSYVWDNGVSDNVTFNPNTTTTYTVTGKDANNCVNTDQIQVAVNPLPTVVANATSTTICDGDAVTLSGSGANTYVWDNGVLDNVAFNPGVTTTYEVTGTDANNCTNTDQIQVVVNPLPTVLANATSTSICTGDAVTLTGSGANTYVWDNSVVDGVAFNPNTTTTYTVTGTDANNCVNTDQIQVVVNPLPTVVANATSTTICDGDAVTLNGSGANTYVWDNAVVDGVAFNPGVTTTYTVTGTDANNCVNTDQIEVVVNPLPTVVANATSTNICNGDAVTLSGSGANTYVWDNGVLDNVAFNPITTTTYTVTGTDANNCTNTDDIQVVVNPLPTVVSITEQCIATNDKYHVSITLAGGSGNYNYKQGVDITPAGLTGSFTGSTWNSTTPINSATAYAIVFYDDLGCEVTASGNHACNCISDAGTMNDVTAQTLCLDQFTIPTHQNDWINDLDDIFTFALSTKAIPNIAADIVAWKTDGVFGFDNNTMTCGNTYYLLAVAGNDLGNGQADFADICLDLSAAIPVTWRCNPNASFEDADFSACIGSNISTNVLLIPSGTATFDYTINGVNKTNTTTPSNHSFILIKDTTLTLTSVQYTDAPYCPAVINKNLNITALDSIHLVSVTETCTNTNEEYTLSITLSGGESITFDHTTVNPPGLIGSFVGNTWNSSSNIPSGVAYELHFNDANNCNTVVVKGQKTCNCSSNAGTVADASPQDVCENASTLKSHNGDEVLDANDVLEYILHDGTSNPIGVILDQNNTGVFAYQVGYAYNTQYYITAVVGNNNAGQVDLNDPCLNTSANIPVTFRQLPDFAVSALPNDSICIGNAAELQFYFTKGVANYSVDAGIDGMITGLANGDTRPITPNLGQTKTYTFTSVSDAYCSSAINQSITITLPQPFGIDTSITLISCHDSVNGELSVSVTGGFDNQAYQYQWYDHTTSTPIVGETNATYTNVGPGTYRVDINDYLDCSTSKILTLAKPAAFKVDLDQIKNELCFNDSSGVIKILTVNGEGNEFQAIGPGWNIIRGDSVFVDLHYKNGIHTYTIIAEDNNGCIASKDFDFEGLEPLSISVSDNSFLCPSTSTDLTALARGGNDGQYSYHWQDEAGNDLFNGGNTFGVTPQETSTYLVHALDSNKCPSETKQITITVPEQLSMETNSPNFLCFGENDTLNTIPTGGTGVYSYEWTNLLNQEQHSLPFWNIMPDTTTSYEITVKDSCGTEFTKAVQVIVPEPIAVTFDLSSNDGCAPLTAKFTNTTTSGYKTRQWNFGNGSSTNNNPTYKWLRTGQYITSLTLIDQYDCEYKSTDTVTVHPNATALFSFFPEKINAAIPEVQLRNHSQLADSYTWTIDSLGTSPDEEPIITFPAYESGSYKICLLANNEYNCPDELCKYISAENENLVFVPNFFTPNGDDLNEGFKPVLSSEKINHYAFMVFDRWGELLFSTSNQQQAWDGTYKNNPVKPDSYVWKLRVRFEGEATIRKLMGNVTVGR
jgi:gliding motility-associated-like protein